MSELHKFLFDGLPVRGVLVRLTDGWTEILRRRASNSTHGAYAKPVQDMLGEMTAAAALLQANIKFDGALILQVMGDGPVKLAVVEMQPDFSFRTTASVLHAVADDATLSDMVNPHQQGRCVITLDPKNKFPGQQPYQGVVPLVDDLGQSQEAFCDVLEQYMQQSEQLETTLVLASNDHVAAGLLIQRLPVEGQGNLAGGQGAGSDEQAAEMDEAYNRIALLARSLKREELLGLDGQTILHRLFWDEPVLRFEPLVGDAAPRFACSCSRERVGKMIVGLGQEEAESILSERATIEVGCEFCGLEYRFDAVDVAQLFAPAPAASSGSNQSH